MAAAGTGGKTWWERYWYREVLPLGMMVMVECANVCNTTLFKAASDQGMNYLVFVFYSYGVSALVLLPLAFFFSRKAHLPPFSLGFLGRICLLATVGFTAQMFGYKGIEYSSPTLSSAISNLTPAITFALAILFGMEKVVLGSLNSQAKIIGTLISISGALVVVLYKGPAVVKTPLHFTTIPPPPHSLLGSSQSNWPLGGLLLTADYILISVWYILQAQIVRMYPAEFLVVFFNNIGITLISGPVCFFLEPDLKVWNITTEIMLLALLYSGIVSSAFGIVVHTWSLKVKGPLYVASFRPLSIAIAAVMGVLFLGDTLFLGSVIGAVMISIGFYVVLWGKAQDDILGESWSSGGNESPAPEDVPLLQ